MFKSEKKVIIKIASDNEENTKTTKKAFKDLQTTASDKENLAGRLNLAKGNITSDLEGKKKKAKILMQNRAVQTGESTITAEDLTSDEPSGDYWKLLAEKRQEALERSLQENEKLKESVSALQEENKVCKEMLKEAENLIEVMKEILNNEGEEDGEQETE